MEKFTTHAYIIRCLTNLHAGSGDANYGVIDKLVQRDQITNYPMIHSSGIKGAVKEYFDKAVADLNNKNDFFKYVFGSTKTSGNAEMRQGEFKFFDANLLLLPVRSNFRPFYRVFSIEILKSLIERFEMMEVNYSLQNDLNGVLNIGTLPVIFANEQNVNLEDFNAHALDNDSLTALRTSIDNLKGNFGEYLALCNDEEQMRSFAGKLPVIARNYLENGQSGNLWFEEVVPRETKFTLLISHPTTDEGNNFFDDFDSKINGKVVQIGANASIGYGSCEFTRISNLES